MTTKKWYKAVDNIGRTWTVSGEAVLEDYIKFLMQADNLSHEVATKQATEGEFPEYWWYEQVVVYPEIVMQIGYMIEDISDEDKQQVLERTAKIHMESKE